MSDTENTAEQPAIVTADGASLTATRDADTEQGTATTDDRGPGAGDPLREDVTEYTRPHLRAARAEMRKIIADGYKAPEVIEQARQQLEAIENEMTGRGMDITAESEPADDMCPGDENHGPHRRDEMPADTAALLDDLTHTIAEALFGKEETPEPAEVDIDDAAAPAIVLTQVVSELDKMISEIVSVGRDHRRNAGPGGGFGLVSARSLYARLVGIRNAVAAGLYPAGKLVTADVLVRTDGEQFELTIDGAAFPWALHTEPLKIDHLTTGHTIVRLPVIANRVRFIDMRGTAVVSARTMDLGEPGDGEQVRDLSDEARTLAEQAKAGERC